MSTSAVPNNASEAYEQTWAARRADMAADLAIPARPRYRVSGSAGQRDGRTYAVLDTHDRQDGKGMRRVSFHRTFAQAQDEAKRLNASESDAASVGEIYARATGSVGATVATERSVHDPLCVHCRHRGYACGRHLETISEAKWVGPADELPRVTEWPAEAPRPWTPPGSVKVDGITVVPGRQLAHVIAFRSNVNQLVADVFHHARERRLELAQIQDPAIRDALSLT